MAMQDKLATSVAALARTPGLALARCSKAVVRSPAYSTTL